MCNPQLINFVLLGAKSGNTTTFFSDNSIITDLAIDSANGWVPYGHITTCNHIWRYKKWLHLWLLTDYNYFSYWEITSFNNHSILILWPDLWKLAQIAHLAGDTFHYQSSSVTIKNYTNASYICHSQQFITLLLEFLVGFKWLWWLFRHLAMNCHTTTGLLMMLSIDLATLYGIWHTNIPLLGLFQSVSYWLMLSLPLCGSPSHSTNHPTEISIDKKTI